MALFLKYIKNFQDECISRITLPEYNAVFVSVPRKAGTDEAIIEGITKK